MTRSNVDIREASLLNPGEFVRNTGIKAGVRFQLWDAAIAAGASLDELVELDRGKKYPIWFKASLIMWHQLHNLVDMHARDASIKKPKGKR